MNGNPIYCPVCSRFIHPSNFEKVQSGEDESYVYVHDKINHQESDIGALFNGIQ